jgi:hypothetical protein
MHQLLQVAIPWKPLLRNFHVLIFKEWLGGLGLVASETKASLPVEFLRSAFSDQAGAIERFHIGGALIVALAISS